MKPFDSNNISINCATFGYNSSVRKAAQQDYNTKIKKIWLLWSLLLIPLAFLIVFFQIVG